VDLVTYDSDNTLAVTDEEAEVEVALLTATVSTGVLLDIGDGN
jgi:hypothetical protein